MTILQIALLALVSVFSSGAVAMGRASRLGVASGIADRAMEQYHALISGQIGLNTGGTTDAGDSVCTGHSGTCGDIAVSGCSSNPVTVVGIGTNAPNPCAMIQNVTGPDGKSYRVDTYIQNYTAPTPSYGSARVLARESSSFDCSTQGGTTFNSGC